MSRRPWLIAALAASSLALLLTSCTSHQDGDNGITHHGDGKGGILSVGTDDGGGSWGMAPPRRNQRWSGSFGLYILCTTGGRSARLEDVTWTSSAEPLGVEVYVRRVPARKDRTSGEDYSPIGMLRGTPDTHPEWGGEFVDYAGQVIDRPCRSEGRPDVDGAREDLVIALTAGADGAALDDFTIAYTSDGRQYALDVAWSMALCGAAVAEGCSGEALEHE